MTNTMGRTRRVIVVDNSHVARRVGARVLQARTRAGLTQKQLAQGRYTAAYISALERGHAKPSMAALTFLSERLAISVTDLIAEERPAADRLEADLLLAAGKPQDALDRYDTLLEAAPADRRQRAEILRGRAEALCRLGRGREAISPATESAEIFDGLSSPEDAAWSRYWLAGAHYAEDNPAEARGILHELLAADRGGLSAGPDFRFRLLAALGNVEVWDGQSERALSYMEEARSMINDVSMGQRASFLSSLALQYRHVGDLERSIRVGHESLALYHAADAEGERAVLEINLGLAFVRLGNLERASVHITSARDIALRVADVRLQPDVAEAEAQLALASGDESLAAERAHAALAGSGPEGPYMASVGAHLTLARIARRHGHRDDAEREYEAAATLLHQRRALARRREVLAEWAELRVEVGDHTGANQLYASALGRGQG